MTSRVPLGVRPWIDVVGKVVGGILLLAGCGDNLATLGDPQSTPDGNGNANAEPASVYTGAGEDGCSGAARSLTVTGVAIYQSVKIDLVAAGMELPREARTVDVVAGRDGLFRILVSVAAGFVPRDLSARVFVSNGGEVASYFSKMRIAADSDESDLRTTFQVSVPKVAIGPDTAYSVEVVECGATSTGATPAGTILSPRFPAAAADFSALGARAIGGLRINIVPVQVNGRLPDTAPADLVKYENMMLAMYPIDAIEMTVGDPMVVDTYPIDWMVTLDQLRARRAADGPDPEVYYFGLMKPADTLRDYCGDSCTMGIAYVAGVQPGAAQARVALAAGFGDHVSIEVMPHEVGHNHGRSHSPCVAGGGTIAGLDPNYPYPDGLDHGYGWDLRIMTLMPPSQADIMGYCNSKWISDYTYQGLLEHVSAVNTPLFAAVPPALMEPRDVLLLDAAGPRWGAPISTASAPAGDSERADILDAHGALIEQVVVYRTAIADLAAYSFEVPRPRPRWASLRVQGAPPIAFRRP